MEIKLALKVNDKDNVATIFANGITDGTEVEIRDKKGNAETVTVIGDVPYGHKIAVRDIKKGELINKYGEEIGIATKDIKKGEYVHVHNLDSMRGRGDWAKEVQMSSQDLKFGKKIIEELEKVSCVECLSALEVKGNFPYRVKGPSTPQAPVTDNDLCTQCEYCVDVCPTHAISLADEGMYSDPNLCIKCCACVKECPEGARTFDTPYTAMLHKNFSARREPEIFF